MPTKKYANSFKKSLMNDVASFEKTLYLKIIPKIIPKNLDKSLKILSYIGIVTNPCLKPVITRGFARNLAGTAR